MSDETMRISAHLSGQLYDEFCEHIGGTLRFGDDTFRVLYQEELPELGYPENDDDPYGPLVIRRESDGAAFEVELEAIVLPVPTPEQRAEDRKRSDLALEQLKAHLAKRAAEGGEQ